MGIVALSTVAYASACPILGANVTFGFILNPFVFANKLKSGTQLSSASSRFFINNDRDTWQIQACK